MESAVSGRAAGFGMGPETDPSRARRNDPPGGRRNHGRPRSEPPGTARNLLRPSDVQYIRRGMTARAAAIVAGGVCLLSPLLFLGQDVNIPSRPSKSAPKEEGTPRSDIRVRSNLVLIPVTVNDPLNRPVSGLERENFRLFDEKIEQTISSFAMDDEQIAAGLVFDTSGSMGDKLKRSRMAASVFFKIADPQDEFFLVEFDSKPRLVVPLTQDTGRIEEELTFSRSHGSTALLDAIYMALQEMRHSKKNKKALLVISDGGDNNSRYTVKEVRTLIQESD